MVGGNGTDANMDSSTIITLPLSPQAGYPLLIAVALAALSLLIYLVLSLQGRKPIGHIDDLGVGWAALLVPLAGVWLALFGLTVAAVFNSTYAMLNDPSQGGIGLGALIAALLGGPFLIWTTILKHRALGFQKEGHLTDRISKAVEQLGAEKTVSYIARNVTRQARPPKEREGGESDWVDQLQKLDRESLTHDRISDEATEYAEWKVFSETVPNIEVRIGGILSLERIAQDSTAYDHGRDHVRVMEILCAYVRENAPASGAKDGPLTRLKIQESIDQKVEGASAAFGWAASLHPPRIDVQIAITALGRRTEQQIAIETNTLVNGALGYKLDLSHTCLQKVDLERLNFANASFFRSRLEGAYCNATKFQNSNFIHCSLVGVGASRANFSGAMLSMTDFSASILDDAIFIRPELTLTEFVQSQMNRVKFVFPDNPNPRRILFNRAFFVNTQLQAARLEGGVKFGIHFHYTPRDDEPAPSHISNLAFRNATLGRDSLLGGRAESGPFPRAWYSVCFGDGSVSIDASERPSHWPTAVLDDSAFLEEYTRYLSNPATYAPPPPPKPTP